MAVNLQKKKKKKPCYDCVTIHMIVFVKLPKVAIMYRQKVTEVCAIKVSCQNAPVSERPQSLLENTGLGQCSLVIKKSSHGASIILKNVLCVNYMCYRIYQILAFLNVS